MNDTPRFQDFPDWLGPMLVKELRQGMKARGFEITFIVLQVVMASVLSFHALLYVRNGSAFNGSGLSAIFWTIVGLQLLAISPLRALGGLANERKANTLELIFMSGLSSWRIVWGKWVSLQFQSLLFVLAILPYGLLRYFFGGVNLTEDLISLTWMIVGSGLLSAIALALSGMPAFARIGAVLFVMLFGMSVISNVVVRLFIGAGGGGPSYTFLEVWPLMVFNVLLIGLASLELGASMIAPAAENHAMRQRLIALAAIIPLPVLKWTGASDTMVLSQIIFFGVITFAIAWWHLATVPTALRVQVEPFSRRRLPGFLAGLVLQPGWPGAVLFLVLSELILLVVAGSILKESEYTPIRTVFTMAAAAMLTPPLFWNIIRTAPKQLVLKHTLVLIACGGMFVFANALENSRNFAFGDRIWPALLPPFGFWAMLDRGLDRSNVFQWQIAALLMLALQGALLVLLASAYWKRLYKFHREISRSKEAPIASGEVAA